MQYIKKSGCKVALITNNHDLQIPRLDVDYTILIGESQNKKIGKHTLLTLVELMALRYYCMYYPSIEELKDHLL